MWLYKFIWNVHWLATASQPASSFSLYTYVAKKSQNENKNGIYKRLWTLLFAINTIHRYKCIHLTWVKPIFLVFFMPFCSSAPNTTITLSSMHAMYAIMFAPLWRINSQRCLHNGRFEMKRKQFDDFVTTNRQAINKYLLKFGNIFATHTQHNSCRCSRTMLNPHFWESTIEFQTWTLLIEVANIRHMYVASLWCFLITHLRRNYKRFILNIQKLFLFFQETQNIFHSLSIDGNVSLSQTKLKMSSKYCHSSFSIFPKLARKNFPNKWSLLWWCVA